MAGDYDSISNRLFTQSGITQKAISKSLERLSSGLRINSASDDAAALNLADKLNTRGANLAIAYRNANDAISLLNVASTATEELSRIVSRLQELSTSASSGSVSGSQRAAMYEEAASLTEEYNRVVSSTEYNKQSIFGSTAYSASVQVGDTGASNSSIAIKLASDSSVVAGNGSFAASTTLTTGDRPYGIDVVDLNNDSILDIVDIAFNGNVATVRLGNGDGTFQTPTSYSTGTQNAYSLSVDDFNNDGKLDLAVQESTTSNLKISLGNGDGTFGTFNTVATFAGTAGTEIISLDVNGDGNKDIVAVAPELSFAAVYLGSGSGTFTLAQSIATPALGTVAPITKGDIDGDGDDDVVFGGSSGAYALFNNSGTLSAPTTLVSGHAGSPVLSDLDQDGDLDLISGTFTGPFQVSLNNGSGSFTPLTTVAGIGSRIFGLRTADINADGFQDVVTLHMGVGAGMGVFLGNGDGTFQSIITRTSGYEMQQFELGDLDKDGSIDIVSHAFANDILVIFEGIVSVNQRQERIRLIDDIDLSSTASAQSAVDYLSRVATDVTGAQSAINSQLSRLTFAGELSNRVSELSTQSANTIRAVDLAAETANLVSKQVRAAGQTALLAQAGSMELEKVASLYSSF